MRFHLGRMNINILDESSSTFLKARDVIQERIEEDKQNETDDIKKVPQVYCSVEWSHIEKMWETGVINLKTSLGLLRGVVMYNCKVFGVRGGLAHSLLRMEHFEVKDGPQGRLVNVYG